ncbi:MAG: ribonuclease HI, partial [Neisseriaceae bacterium]|nr:ribonuclease HI [Neisseriaceae bacterium]
MNDKTVHIFTDGACKGNPGVGGWVVLLRYGEYSKELCGGVEQTTNNQMELTAVIKGLEALKKNFSGSVIVYTDSQYVQKGMSEWIFNWKKNGWKTAAKKPVTNADLWQQLDALAAQFNIQWQWVQGHNGHRDNEIADQLANQG